MGPTFWTFVIVVVVPVTTYVTTWMTLRYTDQREEARLEHERALKITELQHQRQDERRNECVAAYRNLLTRARRRYHRRPAHYCRVRASGHRGEACFTVGLARSEVGSSARSRRFSCASRFSVRGERGAISADG